MEADREGISMPSGLLASLVLLLVQACAAGPSTSSASQTSPSPSPAVARPSALQVLVEDARQDLAKRLSVPLTGVSVARTKTVVWPNASVGCPEPGMAYADVLTPGYQIVLKAEDREYEYHSSRTGGLRFCKNATAPVPGDADDI